MAIFDVVVGELSAMNDDDDVTGICLVVSCGTISHCCSVCNRCTINLGLFAFREYY